MFLLTDEDKYALKVNFSENGYAVAKSPMTTGLLHPFLVSIYDKDLSQGYVTGDPDIDCFTQRVDALTPNNASGPFLMYMQQLGTKALLNSIFKVDISLHPEAFSSALEVYHEQAVSIPRVNPRLKMIGGKRFCKKLDILICPTHHEDTGKTALQITWPLGEVHPAKSFHLSMGKFIFLRATAARGLAGFHRGINQIRIATLSYYGACKCQDACELPLFDRPHYVGDIPIVKRKIQTLDLGLRKHSLCLK